MCQGGCFLFCLFFLFCFRYLIRVWKPPDKRNMATSWGSSTIETFPGDKLDAFSAILRSHNVFHIRDTGDLPSFSSLNKDRWRQQREKKEIKQSTPGSLLKSVWFSSSSRLWLFLPNIFGYARALRMENERYGKWTVWKINCMENDA